MVSFNTLAELLETELGHPLPSPNRVRPTELSKIRPFFSQSSPNFILLLSLLGMRLWLRHTPHLEERLQLHGGEDAFLNGLM